MKVKHDMNKDFINMLKDTIRNAGSLHNDYSTRLITALEEALEEIERLKSKLEDQDLGIRRGWDD